MFLTNERLKEIETDASHVSALFDALVLKTDAERDCISIYIPELIAEVRRLKDDLARQQQFNINQAATIRSLKGGVTL